MPQNSPESSDMEMKTADLWDAFEDQVQVADPIFNNYGGIEAFHGRAVCVKVFEDNVLVKKTLKQNGGNSILVVDGGGSLKCALVGDLLAQLAIDNGWNGMIIFGAIRDSREIGQMDIGLKALNTCPRKSAKKGAGTVGEPLEIAGVTINPGDYVYADRDGILVSERELHLK